MIRSKKSPENSNGAAQRWFLWAAPFVLPSIFFQSSLFAFISPLPLFIVTLKNRTWLSLIAILTNASVVYAIEKDPTDTAFPIWLWFNIGVVFPMLIRRLKRVPVAFFISYALALITLLGSVFYLSKTHQMELVEYVRTEVNQGVDRLLQIPDHPVKKWIEEQGRTEMVHNLMVELPSGIMIVLILCYWFNLLLAFRTLPGFLSRAFWGSYRNPEWLVWPTLVSAFLYIYEDHALYYLGMNGLKVLLVLYGFQGLSIVTFFLNQRQIFGLIRPIIYALLIFVLSPFAFTLGFFDLWFDFRRKFGQS